MTRVLHESYTNNTSATRVLHKRHKCDTSGTRVSNFDFDNGTSKNIFSHPYIFYIASERLQVEEQLYSMNYLLEIPCSHVKMRLKSAPQKKN